MGKAVRSRPLADVGSWQGRPVGESSVYLALISLSDLRLASPFARLLCERSKNGRREGTHLLH